MRRTTKLKIGYVVALSVVGLAAGWVILTLRSNLIALVGITLLLLAPGRIQGFYYRDFFTGRRLFDAHKFAESLPYFEQFLESLRQHPRRETLIWLGWSVYTSSAVAMALNNIGAARLELGELDMAEAMFARALERDPRYPLPHFNMAQIQELRGNHAGAIKAASVARELGFAGSTIDTIVTRAQSILARVEGRVA